jgi:outer membrane immunogenic protein
MKKILLAALLAGVASSALAADLPTHKAAPAPAPYYAPPIFSWTGLYIGANGGWAGGSGGGNFGSPTGGLAGGTIGYNYQVGQFVAGLESDLDWADLHSSGVNLLGAYNDRVDSLVTARARAGIALDHALIFATAGYAGVEDRLSMPGFSSTDWRNGGAIGGGIEYAFTNNISAKAEYIYTPLTSKSYTVGGVTGRSDLNLSLVRAGLNYKF